MAVASILARLRREPLADCPILDCVNQLCLESAHAWRDRMLTPLVTLRLFLLQVLHGNTSIAHLRQLSGLPFAPASYCQARQRLPLAVILGLIPTLARWAEQHLHPQGVPAAGPRVLIVDGSSFTTADTPELHQHFGLYPGAKPGVSYPMGKLLGMIDAATGLFVQLLAFPVLVFHDLSRITHLHPCLRAGDVLLGDRAFCSFAHLALLAEAGVFACFRLHQKRKTGRRRGIERWHKGQRPPAWMTAEQFAGLPEWIEVRLVSYAVEKPGFRTRQVTVATTLLEEAAWPDDSIARLYGKRWEIETCFNHLKTTLGMNVLKCRSVEGVEKELAMYLLAYNLVRLAMLRSAGERGVSPGRISFIDAMRWLGVHLLGLEGVAELIVNPKRTGRSEPRVIRGRLKAYDLLVRPRAELKAQVKSGDKA